MKCPTCGADLVDGAKFCEYCGSPVDAAPAPELKVAPPIQQQTNTYQQPQAPQQPQNQPYGQAPQPVRAQAQYVQPGAVQSQTLTPKCRTFGIISFVLGLWSTAFSWLGLLNTYRSVFGIVIGVFMIGAGIVGLIFSGISRREGNFKLARLGKIFSIIGLCLSAVFWIVGIIIVASIY